MRDLTHHLFLHRERARIAREIHQEFGGALTAISLEVSNIAASLTGNADQCRRLQRAGDLANAAIAKMRRLITELRPAVLDDLGVFATIEWLGREFTHRHHIPCRVHLSGERLAPTGDRAVAVFRVAQEALDNIHRHAAATQVRIDVEVDENCLHLTVADNGRGPPANPMARRGDHIPHSLRGLREVARLHGGDLCLAPQPGGGAVLHLVLPS